MVTMKRAILIGVLAVAGIFVSCGGAEQASSAANRIQPYAENPFYWQHQGAPVLLLGGTGDDNLFQNPNLIEELDRMKSAGGNYVRNTMSSRDEGNVWAFDKNEEGQYDLDRWNEEYWRRFETFLAETGKRDVIVQIEIWATFDYYRDNWEKNPLNPKNNVNYTAEESGLPTEVTTHPTSTENDFFRSVPEAMNLEIALKYQRRLVEKILSYSLEHGHVLYAMDNETSVGPEWGSYWAEFIRRKAAEAGKQVETTEMWDPWDVNHAMHSATYDHPELYTFVDVSQNNHQKGQAHYDNPQKRRHELAANPRPVTNTKIYGADGGRYGTTRDGIERFWRNIFGGHSAARFHRPDSGIGSSEKALRMIRSAREVTDSFDIFTTEPHNDLLGERGDDEAYCLATPGTQFAVYFPRAGEVTLDLSSVSGPVSLRWYDIDNGKWSEPEEVAGGKALLLRTPGLGENPWGAVIH